MPAINRSLPGYDREQAFLPWMRGIARNITAMHRRQQGRRLRREDSWRETVGAAADEHSDPNWDVERLRWCVDRLDGRSRALVVGLYHESRTSDQLGTALGMTAVAVRKGLMLIRRRLKQCLEGAAHA